MERMGAKVALVGKDFDESRLWAEEEAKRQGYRYVHVANEPLIIAGVGTMSLEIMEDLPEVDVIINPIGGGSGCAAHCIARGSSPASRSWRAGGAGARRLPSWKAGKLGRRSPDTSRGDRYAGGLRDDVLDHQGAHRRHRAGERG
jgi:threonine dehydratase